MRKDKILLVDIPKSCSENWEKMEAVNDGKFCNHCKKKVVDFTGFSDTALFNYLRNNPGTCGRFYDDQLQRTIIPLQPKKNSWKKIGQLAAGLISFFAFRNIAIANTQSSHSTYEQSKDAREQFEKTPGDSIRINGRVTDHAGNPLSGAEILWNGELLLTSDDNGRFDLTTKLDYPLKAGIISISYPDLVGATRSYHPVMGDAEFNVSLCPPCRRISMGVPVLTNFELPTLAFDPKSNELSEETKMKLVDLATNLRNHPDVVIELSSGGTTKAEIKKARQILEMVKNWLIDKEGISGDRIIINPELNNQGLLKIIEIKTCTKE